MSGNRTTRVCRFTRGSGSAARSTHKCRAVSGRDPSDEAAHPCRRGEGYVAHVEYPWRVKLARAGAHLTTFSEACDAYVRASGVGFGYERDPAIGSIKVMLQQDAEPPMLLGAIVGDILHNLRSALDAIAWAACQQDGLTAKQKNNVYFPIGLDPAGWPSLAAGKLPGLDGGKLEVFRRLQPWFREETAKAMGISVPFSTITSQPLSRLNELARVDRHRVPHPVLARAGDTWLGSPDGVEIAAVAGSYRLAKPGEVVLEWRVNPPNAVHDVHPDGELILAFSQEAARERRSAKSELDAMIRATTHAVRSVEVEVLEVVTPAQLDQLDEAWHRLLDAETALDSLTSGEHAVDSGYHQKYMELTAAEDDARRQYWDRWRELFE